MLRKLTKEFHGLGMIERFLTLAALIALPVDVVALIGLLRPVAQYQQINPLERPPAIDIGLPSIVWDTRIIDATTLTIILYSAGISLIIFFRWHISSIAREKLYDNIERLGGRKAYVEYYERKTSPLSEEISNEELVKAAYLAILPMIAIIQPIIVLWFRVFVLTRHSAFGLLIMLAISSAVYTLIFLSLRDNQFPDENFEESIAEEGTLQDGFWLPWTMMVDVLPKRVSFWSYAIGVILFLPLILFSLLVILFALFLIEPRRSFKTMLITSYLAFPAFLYYFRASGSFSWTKSFTYSLCILVIALPILWCGMVVQSLIGAHLLKFLFTPKAYIQ